MGHDNTVNNIAPEPGLGWLKVIGLIPVPLFIALTITQAVIGSSVVFEPPFLFPLLNILFLTVISFIVAVLCWRGYARTGAIRILMIGCGMTALGLTSLAAGFAAGFPNGQNLTPTIHNTGALMAALFITAASLAAIRRRPPNEPPEHGRVYATAAYMFILIITAFWITAALQGWISPFFLQDSGFTLLRMAVLGTAIALFTLSSILFLRSFVRWSGFAYWFALGLGLITIGLVGAFLAKAPGTPLVWTSRVATYTGCTYILIGLLSVARISHLRQVPIADEIVNSFALSPVDYNKLTKKQLAKLVERHLDLFENSGTGIVIIDEDGRYLMANKRVAASYKKPLEEIVGRSIYDFLPRETADRYVEFNRQLLRTGEHREYVDTFVLPTGERSFLMVDTCLKDESGKYFAIQHSSIDITEKRRVEEALAASEAKYRSLFNNAEVGMYRSKLDGSQMIEVNDKLCQILGYEREEILSNSAIIHWENDGARNEMLRLVKEQGSVADYEFHAINKKGEIRTFLGSAKLHPHEGYLEGSISDITERKQADEALRESEEKFRSLSEASISGIFAHQGKFVYSNAPFESLTGYSGTELRSMNYWDLISPEFRDLVRQRGEARLQGESIPHRYEVKILRKDGSERWVDAAVTVTKLAGVPTAIGIAVDITDRKNIESELQASHEEMRALAGNLQMAMEEERKRIGRMIHDDLAQTLTALQIELSGLAHRLPDDHKELSAQAAAMNRLITMMNERVKHIAMELRPPLLDDLGLCAAVKRRLNEFSKKTGTLHEVHCDPEDFTLDTDIGIALFRVLQESLTNITRHSEADMVTVHLKKLQDCVSLQIKDNGKGIEKKELASKKSIGIIGMRERVAFFGGKMRITSPADGGTSIDVKIPLGQDVTP